MSKNQNTVVSKPVVNQMSMPAMFGVPFFDAWSALKIGVVPSSRTFLPALYL